MKKGLLIQVFTLFAFLASPVSAEVDDTLFDNCQGPSGSKYPSLMVEFYAKYMVSTSAYTKIKDPLLIKIKHMLKTKQTLVLKENASQKEGITIDFCEHLLSLFKNVDGQNFTFSDLLYHFYKDCNVQCTHFSSYILDGVSDKNWLEMYLLSTAWFYEGIILFDFDSDFVSDSIFPNEEITNGRRPDGTSNDTVLRSIAKNYKDAGEKSPKIILHARASRATRPSNRAAGVSSHNQGISLNRLKAVKEKLKDLGVKEKDIELISFKDTRAAEINEILVKSYREEALYGHLEKFKTLARRLNINQSVTIFIIPVYGNSNYCMKYKGDTNTETTSGVNCQQFEY